MTPTDTDAEIILRSLAEPAAFEEVFERHYAAIHRYLSRRIGLAAEQGVVDSITAHP